MWTFETMMLEPASWLDASGPRSDVVLSTRVRLARNIEDRPFPSLASGAELVEVREKALSAASRSNYLTNALVLRMEGVDDIRRRVLVERHLATADFIEHGAGRATVVGEREIVSIVDNEEDHIRLQCVRPGLAPTDASRLAQRIDSELEQNLHYAFSSDWGYLTACPTNVGTGMRVSVLAHLVGLSRAGRISQVLGSICRLGLSVRGFHGEGSRAQGGFFQISNQATLGQSEDELASNVERVAAQVVALECEARTRLADDEGQALEDEIWRAYGLLTNARALSSGEVMNLCSPLRLGVALGLFSKTDLATLNRLLVVTQPGHISRVVGDQASPSQRDSARAELVRRHLASLN